MSRVVSTDDEARRNSYVWFGPVEMPLPVGARLPAVGWAFFLAPALTVAAWVLTPFVDLAPGPGAVVFLGHVALSVILGAVGTVVLIRRVGRHVSKVTPLRHHVATWQGEVNTPRPTAAGTAVTVPAPPGLWDVDDGQWTAVTPPDLWAPPAGVNRTIRPTIRFED